MVFEGDPHRTLGLAAGATRAEIKAAYRRLAKAFHPDTAGEAAIPRFLAIQAAYEALTGNVAPGSRDARNAAWRADPERARATREGWRRRGTDRTGSRDAGGRSTGPRRPAGPSDGGARPRSRRRSDRAPDRATPGSTTYDGADGEPFDPQWSGASWYGTTSGTYWTINPREYADPRKHGPEYQARGRRRGADDADDDAAAGVAPSEEQPPPRRAYRPAAAERPAYGAGSGSTTPSAEAGSARAHGVALRRALPFRGRVAGRLALALIGWPPLGALVATIAGEASGCSRFAAGCDGSTGIGIWLAQLAIIAILLAVPRLAAISSVGTLVALAVAVPATLLLSVSGGAQERAASVAALTTVLAVAYFGGVIFATVGGSRTLRA